MSYSFNLWEEDADSEVLENGRIASHYRRTFLYKNDMAFPNRPTEQQIVIDMGIVPGSPYPNDPNATCQRVAIGPVGVKTRQPFLAYFVKVNWSTLAPLPNQVNTNPTTMRTVWSLRPTIISRYIVKDRNSNMIVNAAGQPFDGGIPVDVRLGTAVARKNTDAASYDKSNVLANSGKLNSTTYLGAAPKTLQVDIEANEKYEGDYHYWEETYTFTYDPLGWQPKPMNAGFYQLVAGVPTRITDKDLDPAADANPVQEPEPLLTTGAIVPPTLAARPSQCNFIEVDYFPTMDFNNFNL